MLALLEEMPGVYFAHDRQGELMPAVAELVRVAPPEVRARILQLEACDDLPGFYRMLDVFVLPSRYEGFALALLEAIASGLALILSDCPGNEDLKAFGLDGVQWTPPGDVSTLTDRMRACVARWPHPNNHRAIAITHFQQEAVCRGILDLYKSESR